MAKKRKKPQTETDAPKARQGWSTINYGPNRAERRRRYYTGPGGTVRKIKEPRKIVPRSLRVPATNRPYRKQDRS